MPGERATGAKPTIWCDDDEHLRFEFFNDFNEWLESDDAASVREAYGVDGISAPSKAFYAGDKTGYEEAFNEYRESRRNEILNENYLCERFADRHWFERNIDHFSQLILRFETDDVVPFVGAGISQSGGFPTWKEHLRGQGRTVGLPRSHIESLLACGDYETVVAEIERQRGRNVFTQEIRDVYSRTGEITESFFLVSELFANTIITTNYDRLIEQAFDTGAGKPFKVISGWNALKASPSDRVSIIKLHGDVKTASSCILSKNQYDQAYGSRDIDLKLPIPRLLEHHYQNSSLLFLGCSLNNDRTVQVFRAVKQHVGDVLLPQHFAIEQAPESEEGLVERNSYLADLGITGIWYEKGRFGYVEEVLRLARDELRYKGILPRKPKKRSQRHR